MQCLPLPFTNIFHVVIQLNRKTTFLIDITSSDLSVLQLFSYLLHQDSALDVKYQVLE